MGCMKSADMVRKNPVWHSLNIICSFLSFILFMCVVFYNAPLDHRLSTLTTRAEIRFWLLVVNETSNTIIFENGGYKRSNSIELHNDTNEDYTNDLKHRSNINENYTEIEERGLLEERGGGNGIHAYGFGMWGWCTWSDAKWTENAKCTKVSFWTLPKCAAPSWDGIEQVMTRLPDSIKNDLSKASFSLLFVPFLVLSFLLLTLFAINFDGKYPPLLVPPRSKWPKKLNFKTRVAWILRDWRTHLIYDILLLGLTAPTVTVVIMSKFGVTTEMGVGGGLKADVGRGFTVGVVAFVLFLISQILCVIPNGLVFKREKEEKEKSTTNKKLSEG